MLICMYIVSVILLINSRYGGYTVVIRWLYGGYTVVILVPISNWIPITNTNKDKDAIEGIMN